MITTVLNFTNGKIYFIHHEKWDYIEQILFEKYDFNESEIEWMTTEKLNIETLQ